MSAVPAVPQLSLVNSHPVVTSLNLAEVFGKQHKNILQAINLLEVPAEFRRLNFQPTVYLRENPSGGKAIESPMYRITRDSFTLLVMGFTGAKAMQFKLAYIEAFNRMEAELKARQEQPVLGLQELVLAMKGIVDIQLHQSKLLERLLTPDFAHRPVESCQGKLMPRIGQPFARAPKSLLRTGRKTPRRWTGEEAAEVIRLRGQGWSSVRIGQKVNRASSSVRALCADFGVPFSSAPSLKDAVDMQLPLFPQPAPRRNITRKERAGICRHLRNGLSYKDISAKMGWPENTLRCAVRRWTKGGAK